MGRASDEQFADCVRTQYARLVRVAFLLTSDPDDAKDLVQESVAKAFRHSRKIDPDAYAAYLRRVMLNTYLSTSTRAGRLRKRLHLLVQDAESVGQTGQVDTRLELWPLIEKLPLRQRAVVVLRYYEGCSEQEIATVLGCSPGSVKTHASRALKSLRTQLVSEAPASQGLELR